jgi:alpha-ketoglutarate-dependent taurine dioxygenase
MKNSDQSSAAVVDTTLPWVIDAPSRDPVAALRWLAGQAASIRGRLTQAGAVLLRGLPVAGAPDFELVYSTILSAPLPYLERSSPRSSVNRYIYTSTDYPNDRQIFLHNEQSYNHVFCRHIGFYCKTASLTGGQTPLADVRKVLARIDAPVREEFRRRGYSLRRAFGYGMGPSWQEAFGVESPTALEKYCRANAIDYFWPSSDKNYLQTKQTRKVIARHPETGESSWFNHATFFHDSTLDTDLRTFMEEACEPGEFPTATTFGDGADIPGEVMAHLRQAYMGEEVVFDWADGDVLLIDNLVVAHGRRPFAGPRQVLVAMSTPENWANVG